MDIYSKERLEQVMNDLKTKVFPQIKAVIQGRSKKNVGIHNEAVCNTAAGTAAKTVIAPSTFGLSATATIIVTFANAISVANATLAFGTAVDDTADDYAEKNPVTEGWYELSGGTFELSEDTTPQSGKTYYTVSAAKPIFYRGAALPANAVKAGSQHILRYDGTNFNIIGDLDTDTDTVTDVTFDNNTKTLKQTKGGVQSNIVQIVTSGFSLTSNETTGYDTITAIGSADVTPDDTTGYDAYTF